MTTWLRGCGASLRPLFFYRGKSSIGISIAPERETDDGSRRPPSVMFSIASKTESKIDTEGARKMAFQALDVMRMLNWMKGREDRIRLVHQNKGETKTLYLGVGKEAGTYGISIASGGSSGTIFVDGDELSLLEWWMKESLHVLLEEEQRPAPAQAPDDAVGESGGYGQ